MGEEPRANALAAPLRRHGHLPQLQGVGAEGPHRHGADHGAVGERAEMPPARVVRQLLIGDGETEWFAQQRLAQPQRLAIERRAAGRVREGDADAGHCTRHRVSLSAMTVNRPRASRRAPPSNVAKKRIG